MCIIDLKTMAISFKLEMFYNAGAENGQMISNN
jgi:hypothetical protein